MGGPLSFRDQEGNEFSCGEMCISVPNHVEAICNVESVARYILVVEKEAIFTRLMESKFCQTAGPCILLTGKGFPDINTRMLLKELQRQLKIPALGLVDADPHGIDIMCVYRYGSKALSYEAASLTCPALRWLGVLPSDIEFVGVTETGLIPMSDSDSKRANDLLKRPYISQNEEMKSQIRILLDSRTKCEIESLDSISRTFLTDIYLPQKIRNGDWI